VACFCTIHRSEYDHSRENKVSSGEVGALEAAVKANPLYTGKASELFLSNGFTRGTKANFNRATFTQVFKW
jgi:hypothetical protein